MDYRKIFCDVLDTGCQNNKTVPSNLICLEKGDIVEIDDIKYLVLKPYGKFHRLYHMIDCYEYVVNLNKRPFSLILPYKLKEEIIKYEKKDLNIKNYLINNYLKN